MLIDTLCLSIENQFEEYLYIHLIENKAIIFGKYGPTIKH